MTIVSTKEQSAENSPAYPPVDDFINFVKGINWENVGISLRKGTAALLLFAMTFSEKSYDFHEYLYTKVLYDMK